MIKKISALFFIFLFCFLLSSLDVSAQKNQEIIKNFNSQITINTDGSMIVAETIIVHSEGIEIKRGIYRDFPIKYKDKLGNNYNVGFELIAVKRDGQITSYDTENLSNGIRIYIRDKNVYLPVGDYTFEIIYRTTRQLGFFADHDELYWNVTGNGWAFPIEQASAEIILPEGVSSDQVNVDGYTGPNGAKDKNFTSNFNDGSVVFATSKSLPVNHGLTIVVGWPKGFVHEPTTEEKRVEYVKDNLDLFASIVGLIIILIYYFYIWNSKGKDPKKGTIIPFYDAPENLSPASVGYIYHMGFYQKSFAAAIINLAIKGHIKIENKKGKYHLLKLENGKGLLSIEESQIFKELFLGSNEIVLKNENYETISRAKSKASRELSAKFGDQYFVYNLKYWLLGLIISIAVIILIIIAFRDFPVWMIVFYVIINIIFFVLLRKLTIEGRKFMDQIQGFKWFLSVTEKQRMNFHNPPEKTPELFEKFLPFALVLGVQNKWAKQFKSVFDQLQDQGNDYAPSWYYATNFSAVHFASSFSNSFNNAIVSSSVAPGSSSGMGGGFSGGGGGGGGGGGC